ncbi:MAG: DUF1295 domain-containing protein [Firmicutes bacterium]|nr:DUF1295 domain-containing protein [Bacillota bacterium]
MSNKAKSLIKITLIYLLAFGAAAAFLVPLQLFGLIPDGSDSPRFLLDDGSYMADQRLLFVFLADFIAMVIIWLFSLHYKKNICLYDPYWGVSALLLIPAFYFINYPEAQFEFMHLIVLIPLCFWAIRRTVHWAGGFQHLDWNDWRYYKTRKRHPKLYHLFSFLWVMLVPTVLVYAGMIPFSQMTLPLDASEQQATHLLKAWMIIIGGVIIAVGAIYQWLADRDMARFREKIQNRNKNIDVGLWRHSRHPNYFGEILIWAGLFIASIPMFIVRNGVPVQAAAAVGAIMITLYFFWQSVPMMEKHLEENRPQYKQYKSVVISPIIPFKRKKTIGEADPNANMDFNKFH